MGKSLCKNQWGKGYPEIRILFRGIQCCSCCIHFCGIYMLLGLADSIKLYPVLALEHFVESLLRDCHFCNLSKRYFLRATHKVEFLEEQFCKLNKLLHQQLHPKFSFQLQILFSWDLVVRPFLRLFDVSRSFKIDQKE